MKIEHVAFQVDDPAAMARWWTDNLGFTVKRKMDEPPHTHFIADDSGTVMIELYRHPHLRVPDYRDTDAMLMHVAFVSHDIQEDRSRLTSAGATPVGEIQETPDGDSLAMLRDPWGFPVQLVKRKTAMF